MDGCCTYFLIEISPLTLASEVYYYKLLNKILGTDSYFTFKTH